MSRVFQHIVVFLLILLFSWNCAESQTIIWQEVFNGVGQGATVDNGSTAWSIDLATNCGGSIPATGTFAVSGNRFLGSDTDCDAIWQSEWIDISTYASVQLLADFFGTGSLDSNGALADTCKFGYRLDGSSTITWIEEYAGSSVSNATSCGGAVSGDSVQLIVQMLVSGADEFVYVDNVTVREPDLPSGGGDTLFSIADGAWNAPGTWSNGYGGGSCGCTPDSNSVVYITCDTRVTIPTDVNAREVYVLFGGELDWTVDNSELYISSNGVVDIAVGGRLWENGTVNAAVEFAGAGTHYLRVYDDILGLEMDLVRVTNNCSLIVQGNGRIDIEDDFELDANGATVVNEFTSQLYVFDDLDMLADNVTFVNDSGFLYLDGTLEILGQNALLINRDSIYIDLDFHCDDADNSQITNFGYILCNDDILTSNNSENLRIDNFGVMQINDDLRESVAGADAAEFHNRTGGYLYLAHDNVSLNWELWAGYADNTVDYFRAGDQVYMFTPQDAYWNLTLSGNGEKRAIQPLDIDGDVLIADNAEFNIGINSAHLEVAGDWTITSGLAVPFDYGLADVTFNGTSSQTITAVSGAYFYDVILDKPDSVILASEMIIDTAGSVTFSDGHLSCDSTNRLIFRDDARALGASDASFVEGRVEKIGDDTFNFPVGDEGYYQPILISAPTVASHSFSAQYYFDRPGNNWNEGALESGVNHISTEEYWILNRTSGTSDVFVRLSFDVNSGGVNVPDSLVVCRWNGTQWANEGNGAWTGDPTSGTVTTANAVTAFSPFTLGSVLSTFALNPLPVELISFTSTCDGDAELLQWTVASEIDVDYYLLESKDGTGDREVKMTEVQVQSPNGYRNYAVRQSRLYDMATTVHRLYEVDLNGKRVEIASTAAACKTFESMSLGLYPNPVSGTRLFLNTGDLDHVSYQIWSLQGMLIRQGRYSSNDMSIGIGDLAPGSYMLTVSDDSGASQHLPFIKQ